MVTQSIGGTRGGRRAQMQGGARASGGGGLEEAPGLARHLATPRSAEQGTTVLGASIG